MTAESPLVIQRLPEPAQVDLRVDPSFAPRVDYPLPLEPNRAWEEGQRGALWLGPDQWLLIGPAGTAASIIEGLEASLAGAHRSVVDVSANRAVFELRGDGVREVLSKGCSIDLHPRVWTPGSCAQTIVGKAPAILHERADALRILVRWSFADYLTDWLRISSA